MCADNVTGGGVEPVRRRFRALKWISVVIVAVLAAVFFGVPAFLSSSAGTGFIVDKVNGAVDGEIDMGDLNVGWFKGVHLKEFSFADDKGMAKVNVREITAKPHYVSMLSGNISLGKVVIDKPEVVIRLDGNNNDSPLPSDNIERSSKSEKSLKGGKGGEGSGFNFEQIDLTIKEGDIKITPPGGDVSNTIHFINIASNVDLKPSGKESSFDVALDIESKGKRSKFSANGNAKPSKKGWSIKGTEGDVTVKVDDLDLSTLAPVFVLLGKDIEVEGKLNVNAEVKFGDGQVEKLVVDAALDKFKHIDGDKQIALDEPLTLKGRVSSKSGKVDIEDINLKSSFCTITGKGAGNELDYEANMDIGKTMDFVGTFVDLGGYSFSGSGWEKGHITFKDDTIRFSDHSSIDNFVMSKKDEKGKKSTPATTAKFTFDMTVDTKKENLKIDFLTMKTTDTMADIRIDGSEFSWAKGADDKIDMKIKADIDLAKTMPFMTFFEAMDEKTNLSGLVKSGLLVRSSDSELKIVTDNTTVTNFKLEAEDTEKTFEDELIKVKFDMAANYDDKTFSLKEFSVDGTQIDIEGNVKQSQVKNEQVKLSGKVTAKYDLEDVSTIASAYLPEGLEAAGKRSDTFTFQSQYPQADKTKMAANLNGSGKFGFDTAKYKGMKFGKTDVTVDIKKGMVDIVPFTTTVNGGLLNFAGNVDLTKEPVVFRTASAMQIIDKVQVDDEMGKALLKYLNPLFADQADMTGIANLYCEKFVLPLGGDTAIADAYIDGTVGISGMNLSSTGLLGIIMSKGESKPIMKADMLPTKIVMDKGIISYDNMQVNIDDVYPINFKGAVDLNVEPGSLDMVAALPYRIDARKGGLDSLKLGENDKGRLVVKVEGNVEKNGIDWGKALLDTGLKSGLDLLEGYLNKDKKDNDSEKSSEEQIIEGILDLF